MANARRRDEWDRMGWLLSMVHNRTMFSEKDSARTPDSFWPPSLITSRDRKHVKASIPKLKDGKALQAFVGLK